LADDLQTFRTRIRRYLRETNADTSFWTEPFLNQMFNASYRHRCAQLIMAFEGFFTQVATRDLTADKDTYGLPEGTQRVLKIELVRSDGTTVPLERWERHDESNPTSTNSSVGDSYLPNYRPLSNGFKLEPGPTETVTDGLRIEYSGVPVILSANADKLHPSYPELLDELLVLDTVVLALQAEGVHEAGPQAAIYRMRSEWEFQFERFIEQRFVSRDRIDPFIVGPDIDY